jgi:hypothetical protein
VCANDESRGLANRQAARASRLIKVAATVGALGYTALGDIIADNGGDCGDSDSDDDNDNDDEDDDENEDPMDEEKKTHVLQGLSNLAEAMQSMMEKFNSTMTKLKSSLTEKHKEIQANRHEWQDLVTVLVRLFKERRRHMRMKNHIIRHDKKLKDVLRKMFKPLFEFALVEFEKQVEAFSTPEEGQEEEEDWEENEEVCCRNSAVIIKKILMKTVKLIISEEIKQFGSSATSTLQMALEELVVKMSQAAIFKFGIVFPKINDNTPDVLDNQEKVTHFF